MIRGMRAARSGAVVKAVMCWEGLLVRRTFASWLICGLAPRVYGRGWKYGGEALEGSCTGCLRALRALGLVSLDWCRILVLLLALV